MQSPRYSIVLPTYNHCDDLLKPCVDSILKYSNLEDIELIISYNGCTDETKHYVTYLTRMFENKGLGHHIKYYASDKPTGFIQAVNNGIKVSTGQKVVILNNDIVLLEQEKNTWLKRLDVGDFSGVLSLPSEITKRNFFVFFCVMIDRKVIDKIGLLDETFDLLGGCDDIDYCYRAEQAGFTLIDVGYKNDFPIYHIGEATLHQPELIDAYKKSFYNNELKLAKRVNPEYYRYMLSNNYERAVFLKGDPVFPRETTRYEWAKSHLDKRETIVEIGCSTGYGSQFFPSHYDYVGLDYDPLIIQVAKEQEWGFNRNFVHADINTYDLGYSANIVAFEVIEHLDNGLEIVEKLKQHCDRLLISVPWNEPKGFWGEHHKLHGLNESHFEGFTFGYINHAGEYSLVPENINAQNPSNLMLCKWSR